MTVFVSSGTEVVAGKQIFPVDYEVEVSQRLVDASHNNDLKSAYACIADPFVDVNFMGTVSLKGRKTEIVLHEESAHEVLVEYEEFKTEVNALFLAAHTGNLELVRILLSIGANVNQRVFRGYATTAAVREGHMEILEVLLSAGACQQACEESLLEASYLGLAMPVELLMRTDMVRPQVAVHALVSACCRGFVNVVDALIQCGVDANATSRVLLQSSKPFLHSNFDCNALVAAIVSRQISVVRLLLKVGVRTDIKMRVGAWFWDMETGEEFRVGAGLAEPYPITWCAVEYFEATGAILHMLLQHLSLNTPHYGRTLIHHAILCNTAKAVDVLGHYGTADVEFLEKATSKTKLRPIHLAARLGFSKILQCLISAGCNLNSRTESGETALMVCARFKHEECLKILASAGADFGLVNTASQCASSIAHSARWTPGFQQAVVDVILADKVVQSSNVSMFSPLLFVVEANEIEALKKLIKRADVDLDEQDANGFSAAMIAAKRGRVEAFRLLVYAGADIELHNKYGETAIDLFKAKQNSETFEKLMIEYVVERGNGGSFSSGFYALHRAAFLGDINSVRKLTIRGYDVNALDDDGYTPLMLSAMRGHSQLCELLISCGARCDVENERHETALMLARKNGCRNGAAAERVIFDEIARTLVLDGARVKKHTKGGRGAPHVKVVRMVGNVGVLQWGKSSKRNVICQWAEVGSSAAFRWNRRRKFDADEPGMFHVVTTKNKVLHFVCDGGVEMAELWVRGMELVTREAVFGKQKSSL
ncbi:uncharacterized protein LOC132178481 [Corylus avellana]|uniref:uncharacterized protein LOC132178481 n=1 Tax=Corylus avellana TaxID=13451 RepID=UPI00286B947E|nr:uncharacterized protein LOC132178481 [Corylus avellana]